MKTVCGGLVFLRNAVILDYSIFPFFSTLFVGFITTARYKKVCFMNSFPVSKVTFLSLFRTRVTRVLSWGYQKVVHSLQNFNGRGIRGISFIVTCLKEKEKDGFQGVGCYQHLTITLWKYHWASLDLAHCMWIYKFNKGLAVSLTAIVTLMLSKRSSWCLRVLIKHE